MEKRALLAVVLSITVFYLFSFFFGPDKKQPPVQNPSAPVATNLKSPEVTAPPLATPVSVAKTADKSAVERDVIVENDLFKAVFSTRGAALKSLILKKYKEESNPKSEPVILGANSDPSIFNFSSRASGFNFNETSVFSTNTDNLTISSNDSKQLIFSFISDQGFVVRKIYSFAGSSYAIKLETQVINNSPSTISGVLQHLMSYPSTPKVVNNRFDTAGSYIYLDNGLKTDKAKDVANSSKKYDKNPLWAGFADKYFIASLLSVNGSIASVELKKSPAGFLETIAATPQFTVNSGKTVSLFHNIFVGPKDIDILKSQGNSLEQSLDLGWFTVLAKPLLYTLKFFYKYVGNYGLAIIIITVILKMLFFPLTHKSHKSMKDMQKVQPMMAALKEKFKDDKEALNKAVMELYREHKVNPMSGCLPMFIQIPVFFALYKALMFSIELRHAPFFLWVTDLSGPDNLFGNLLGLPFVLGPLPLVMGATMFIQQKLTPTNMDPLQAKMMLALPLVFTIMFLNFPSGLVLYWLVNNILTIGQQMYINKITAD